MSIQNMCQDQDIDNKNIPNITKPHGMHRLLWNNTHVEVFCRKLFNAPMHNAGVADRALNVKYDILSLLYQSLTDMSTAQYCVVQ